MDIRFYIDPGTGQPHLQRHGVSEAEALQVLAAPLEDGSGTEGSRVAIGRSDAGRLVRVIYVPDPDGQGLFVITAYPLGPKAVRALRRRLGKRS